MGYVGFFDRVETLYILSLKKGYFGQLSPCYSVESNN